MSKPVPPSLDPPMLRLFVVQVYNDNRVVETIRVIGNVSQVLDNGTLQILRYYGDIPWTVRLLAESEWKSVEAALPTPEDVARLDAYNTTRDMRARAMAQDTGKVTH